MNTALFQACNKASLLADSCGSFDLNVWVGCCTLFWAGYFEQINRLACRLVEAEVLCTLYTDMLTSRESVCKQVWALHRDISGWALFPEKQLLFGYGGNEMGGGGAHLRKWPCTLMSRPQPVTCRNSTVCTFHSWGFTRSLRVCLCSVRPSFIITCLYSQDMISSFPCFAAKNRRNSAILS